MARRWDTGTIRPYRPMPADFREVYLRMGWDGITDHYATNDRCIRRWIEEAGGDALRAERSRLTGTPPRPYLRRDRERPRSTSRDERDRRLDPLG